MEKPSTVSAKNSVRFGNASDGFYLCVYGEEGDKKPPIHRIRFGKITRSELVIQFMRAMVDEGQWEYHYSDWQSTCRFDIERTEDRILVNYWAISIYGENKQWEMEFDPETCMTVIGIMIPRSEFIREISIPYKTHKPNVETNKCAE